LTCTTNNPATSNTVTMVVGTIPIVEAGNSVTYTGTPVQIGDANNGPGAISWSPAAGLNNAWSAQPIASPSVTTTYTLTVNNSGCVRTDTVTVHVNLYRVISGKTRYLGKAFAGNPAPNQPTYNAVKYNIGKVIVILKTNPGGIEVTRDTSDAQGLYALAAVPDGNYILSYDKYTVDTMQTGNEVNAVDIALMKYMVGHDTMTDPSRNFSAKYRRAINVDNNLLINAVDVARIKGKVGAPYDPAKNFPKGNWVAFDTAVTVAGANLNITLKTICYGDYDASSTKYKDSTITWSMAKALPDENIINTSMESMTINNTGYFEIPLKINSKMNEFSAMGLELTYPDKEFKLVSAYMPKTTDKANAGKINPTLDEIIADDNDLLVTDIDGVIRVVYATTNHFDVDYNDEMIVLGFQTLSKPQPGELEFDLAGTGLIADQYGVEDENAYLSMPRLFVQGDDTEAGFEFAGYPNPFNDNATLKYRLPENGLVKIRVYNAIGELVTELVNESQQSGYHAVEFRPENLPAGMYTFRLEYTGANTSKYMVLKLVH
ncbi:MAG TPA: T9SS type A sorting domain-containing protein, partial [Bacteroidales bacterium]|nr:T9SS type A sorting domain-containing protein [Bacteroidales bacterium]